MDRSAVLKRLILVPFFALLVTSPAIAELNRQVPESQSQIQLSFAPVVKKTAPAVVNIYTKKVITQRYYSPFVNDPFFQHFFGRQHSGVGERKRLESSLGSGVIVKPDGVIITNNHVVSGADEITIVLSDRREFQAKVLSNDPKSDLAVLKIEKSDLVFPYLELKDSDDIEVGDIVLAIGNPFGVGQTVTTGIVSGLARTGLDINDINYYIQTDAAINPGNSGGALVGIDGRLLGINTAIFTKSGGNMGIGFAIPSNMVRSVVAASGEPGRKHQGPWVGVRGQDVTADIASSLGLPVPQGVLVKDIHIASPAIQSGLRKGDVILRVNGRTIEDSSAFLFRIATFQVGDVLSLDVYRSGNTINLKLNLIEPPEIPKKEETILKGNHPLDGASVVNLSPAISNSFGFDDGVSGVVISSVAEGSIAHSVGFVREDLILEVNDVRVKNVQDIKNILSKPAPLWVCLVRRKGEIIKVYLRL